MYITLLPVPGLAPLLDRAFGAAVLADQALDPVNGEFDAAAVAAQALEVIGTADKKFENTTQAQLRLPGPLEVDKTAIEESRILYPIPWRHRQCHQCWHVPGFGTADQIRSVQLEFRHFIRNLGCYGAPNDPYPQFWVSVNRILSKKSIFTTGACFTLRTCIVDNDFGQIYWCIAKIELWAQDESLNCLDSVQAVWPRERETDAYPTWADISEELLRNPVCSDCTRLHTWQSMDSWIDAKDRIIRSYLDGRVANAEDENLKRYMLARITIAGDKVLKRYMEARIARADDQTIKKLGRPRSPCFK